MNPETGIDTDLENIEKGNRREQGFETAAETPPVCPRCDSEAVLPFEDEETTQTDTTLFFVILSAFLVLTGYFLFMISTYVFFPVVVFISIIVTTRMLNRKEKHRKAMRDIERNYMCTDCGEFFKHKQKEELPTRRKPFFRKESK
jgi:hypothetical protein